MSNGLDLAITSQFTSLPSGTHAVSGRHGTYLRDCSLTRRDKSCVLSGGIPLEMGREGGILGLRRLDRDNYIAGQICDSRN